MRSRNAAEKGVEDGGCSSGDDVTSLRLVLGITEASVDVLKSNLKLSLTSSLHGFAAAAQRYRNLH